MKKTWCLVLALALTGACGKKKNDGGGGTASGGGGGDVTLDASGATFQKAAQEVAIEAFTKTHTNVKINYGGGGSGKGRQDFADKVVDFACTDAPYKEADAGKVKEEFFYLPNVLGAITVSYNVEGVDKLDLSPETIAKIFQRRREAARCRHRRRAPQRRFGHDGELHEVPRGCGG
jgi:phosphate transport system substrate-binding protein